MDVTNDPPVFTLGDKLSQKKKEDEVPLEEALDIAGMGRYNYTLYAICNITLLAMALETFGTSYIVTASVCDFQLTTETKGLVGAMPMLGIVVSSYPWGWLADTRGRRTVLLWSMGGSCVFAFASSLSPNWVYLAAFKFIAAFFASASNSVTYALFGECTPTSHRNTLVMLMSSGLMFAQAVMSINAYPILRLHFSIPFLGINYTPWRLLEQCYGLWCGVAALCILLLVKESPKFYCSQGQNEKSLKVLSEIYAINKGKKAEEYPVKAIIFQETTASSKKMNVFKSIWEQTVPMFMPPLLWKTLVLLYIVILVYAISPAFLMWMPMITNSYSKALAHSSEDNTFCSLLSIAKQPPLDTNYNVTLEPAPCISNVEDLTYLTLLVLASTMSLCNLLNSYIIKFVGKRSIVIFLHLLGGVCSILLPWINDTKGSLLVFFLAQANLIAMGLTTGFTIEVYPTYLRATAVCMTVMVGRGVSFLTISYVGVLLERYCDATFYVFGALILSGAVVGLFLPTEQNNAKKKVGLP